MVDARLSYFLTFTHIFIDMQMHMYMYTYISVWFGGIVIPCDSWGLCTQEYAQWWLVWVKCIL